MKTNFFKSLVTVAGCLVVMTFSMGTDGCNRETKVIDKAEFNVSPNLEFITVKLKFDRSIRPAMQGDFPVKLYGALFINPYQNDDSTFEVGFRLNTHVLDDPDYSTAETVRTLTNGMPLPVAADRGLVQIDVPTAVNQQFEVHGYIDAYAKQWIGVAVMLKQPDANFPAGTVINETYFKGDGDRPGVVISAFGPSSQNGSTTHHGGVVVFGDVIQLIRLSQSQLAVSQ